MTDCDGEKNHSNEIVLSSGESSSDGGSTMSKPCESSRRGRTILFSFLLFLLVLGVFLPAVRHEFITYDDQAYVTENREIQRGLTWDNVRWAFGGIHIWFYYPLTLLSHAADCQFFGLNPAGHHFTSVLFHALNAVLLFLVLKKITGGFWRSLIVATIFGLHPLRVESVAWVAERKDVLSTFFWLLAMMCYARWLITSDGGRPLARMFYTLSLAFFAMGLLAKPMVVSLPFALLLLDWWPLNRISADRQTIAAGIKRCFVEKIPFFLLAAMVSAITFVAQKSVGAVSSVSHLPFVVRIDNALISYCRYIAKTFVPVKLALLYPYNQANWPAWQVFTAAIVLLTISGLAILHLRKRAYLAVGWFWFVGTLIPAIGLVQVGGQAMADRFTYIPSIGILVAVVWAAGELAKTLNAQKVAIGVGGVVVVGLVATTHHQLGYWKNSETLYRHSLKVTEDNVVMHYNLGTLLAKDPERTAEAIVEFKAVLKIEPLNPDAHVNLADLLERTGQVPEAMAHYEKALSLHPEETTAHAAHYSLGLDLARAGQLPDAIAHLQEALRIKPGDADGHINIGIALFKSPNRLNEAIPHFEEALRLNPNSALAHYNLGASLARFPDRAPDAITHYEMALRLKPELAPARQALERLRVAQK